MKNTNSPKRFFLIAMLFFYFSNCIYSNTLFGGIEIGSKGIKVTVLDVENAKKNLFTLKEYWTTNAGIAKGISVDGNLATDDIETAANIILEDYNKLLNTFNVEDKNIFIVASSGIALAKNTNELADKIRELTKKEIDVISSKLESKLMFRGSIAKKFYLNSLLLDIGGGNTKGGYVEVKNDENNVFFPFNLDYGTITLTEKINKGLKSQENISSFKDRLFEFNTELETEIKKMYDERPDCRSKKNVYITGGAAWAFFTLSEQTSAGNFSEISFADVQDYDAILKNNFKKIIDLAETNDEAKKVLKTYSQKYLISANTLLTRSLEALGDIKSKKIFFVKQAQISWLLSYVADSAKGAKVIY